jgi:hypothetical protein
MHFNARIQLFTIAFVLIGGSALATDPSGSSQPVPSGSTSDGALSGQHERAPLMSQFALSPFRLTVAGGRLQHAYKHAGRLVRELHDAMMYQGEESDHNSPNDFFVREAVGGKLNAAGYNLLQIDTALAQATDALLKGAGPLAACATCSQSPCRESFAEKNTGTRPSGRHYAGRPTIYTTQCAQRCAHPGNATARIDWQHYPPRHHATALGTG